MSDELVRNFLLARGVDSDAADYAASLTCIEDDDSDPEALREFIAEACPDETSDALDDLFATIERCSGSGGGDRGGRGSGSSHPRPPPDTSSSAKDQHLQVSPSALLRALELRSTKVEEEEQEEEDEGAGGGRRRRNANDGDDDDDSCGGEADDPGASAEGVDSLLELFPGRGRDYLAHALRINGADVSEAATWLSSSSSAAGGVCDAGGGGGAAGDDNGESAWRAAREERRRRRRAERAADEAARARLLEKFDATAVVTSGELGGAGGGGRGAPIRLWGEAPGAGKKGGSGSSKEQQRFRDGVAVTSKGEKYITIKEGEEWDGGSRGRVVLKGKRGAGGVKLAK